MSKYDEEIEYRIIKSFGTFSGGTRNWVKEVNLVSWNRQPAKLDIRNWQRDHKKCGKGIALTRGEAEELVKLLGRILKEKPSEAKTTTRSQTGSREERNRETRFSETSSGARGQKKPPVPQSLRPFYNELQLVFGSDPAKCKSARNTLLKKFHPDKNAVNIASATAKTIKIKEAYEKIIAWWNEQK